MLEGSLDLPLRRACLFLTIATIGLGEVVRFEFGEHLLDVDRHELHRVGEQIAVEPAQVLILGCRLSGVPSCREAPRDGR
jgi:hypothetical protein